MSVASVTLSKSFLPSNAPEPILAAPATLLDEGAAMISDPVASLNSVGETGTNNVSKLKEESTISSFLERISAGLCSTSSLSYVLRLILSIFFLKRNCSL